MVKMKKRNKKFGKDNRITIIPTKFKFPIHYNKRGQRKIQHIMMYDINCPFCNAGIPTKKIIRRKDG